MARRTRLRPKLLALLALAWLASCADAPRAPTTAGSVTLKEGATTGEGVFVIDLSNRAIVQLAALSSPDDAQNFVKYSFLDRGNGSFDFAYVPEAEGRMYAFTALFGRRAITSSAPSLALQRSERSSLNGPAYCQARDELGFGNIEATFVSLETIAAAEFAALDASTLEAAEAAGKTQTIVSADFEIATDLACGNLPSGLVYDHLDCHDSTSINDCLSAGNGNGISTIQAKDSASAPARQLTFPEDDAKIRNSPHRPVGSTLGDNGPAVFVSGDGSLHLAFERLYSTPAIFDDPTVASEFMTGGFNALYYKRIVDDPRAAPEYEIDFSRWLARPAPHASITSSDIRADHARPAMIEFVASGDFKGPGENGFDEDVFVGMLRGRFDTTDVDSSGERRIVLDPAQVEAVLTYAGFTCRLWDAYGMAPTGTVYLYAVLYPRLLRGPGGSEFITFSTIKGAFGTLADGIVTLPDGSSQPAEALHDFICAQASAAGA